MGTTANYLYRLRLLRENYKKSTLSAVLNITKPGVCFTNKYARPDMRYFANAIQAIFPEEKRKNCLAMSSD